MFNLIIAQSMLPEDFKRYFGVQYSDPKSVANQFSTYDLMAAMALSFMLQWFEIKRQKYY